MIEIKTVEEFENIISNGKLTVIKFGAEWCGPCKSMHKTLSSISEKTENVVFCEIDIEEAPEIAERFNIRNIPATLIVKDGEPVDMVIGFKTENEMVEKIKQFE